MQLLSAGEFSYVAVAEGTVLGVVLAGCTAGPAGVVSLACISVHQELEQQTELLRCLLQLHMQLLLAAGHITRLAQGAPSS